MMNKENFSIVVHGGAGPDSQTIRENIRAYKATLGEAVNKGYQILETGGSSVDAVQAAVELLENHPLFNAGRGAVLNHCGEVEMCAAIMDGNDLRSGAVALVQNVKNPVAAARAVMDRSAHVYLGGKGAMAFAREVNAHVESDEYFITPHQEEAFAAYQKKEEEDLHPTAGRHGTVGAVACDQYGNLAAATSTGGLEFSHAGRIADSSMVGAGVYANNNTCAVSATGDGEYIIRHVLSYQLQAILEYSQVPFEQAATFLIKEKLAGEKHDMGLIAVNRCGAIAMAFNSERMHRAWKTSGGGSGILIYEND